MKAVIVDANFCIAIAAREEQTYPIALTALASYFQNGFVQHSPNTLITETLFALCRKLQTGVLTEVEHAKAVRSFERLTNNILFPDREASLISRANEMQAGYGCSRNADCLYIALAEQLMSDYDVVELVTFDKELPNQAARHAPEVTVRLLEV